MKRRSLFVTLRYFNSSHMIWVFPEKCIGGVAFLGGRTCPHLRDDCCDILGTDGKSLCSSDRSTTRELEGQLTPLLAEAAALRLRWDLS